MNSQFVSIRQAVKSNRTFLVLTALVPVSLFFRAGFVSVSVLWFLALAISNKEEFQFSKRKESKLILLLPPLVFLVYFFSGIFTGDFMVTQDILLRKGYMGIIPLSFLMINKTISRETMHTLLTVFLSACIACSVVCLAGGLFNIIRSNSFFIHTVHGDFPYLTYARLTGQVDIQPLYMSMFSNMAFIATLTSPFLHSTQKKVIGLYLIVFVLMIGSVAGIICLTGIILGWLIKTIRLKKSKVSLAALLVLIAAVIIIKPATISDQFKFDKREHYGKNVRTISSRVEIWTIAINVIKEKPLIGHGIGEGQKALEQAYRENGFDWGAEESLNTHNEFLSIFLDVGAVGFCILAFMVVYSACIAIKSGDFLAISFMAMMILFLSFESLFARQKGIVFFSFFYSLIFSHLMTNRKFSREN